MKATPFSFVLIPMLLALVACSSTDSDTDAEAKENGETMGRMEREFSEGGVTQEKLRERRSQYDQKQFGTKDFKSKEFKTSEANLRKLWSGADTKFNSGSKKTPFDGVRSTYEGQTSRFANEKAATKAFWASDKSARTKSFADADKSFATKRADAEGKAFWQSDREASTKQLGRNAQPTVDVFRKDSPNTADISSIRKLLGKDPD